MPAYRVGFVEVNDRGTTFSLRFEQLDNTGAERALRGIAVGRKNWMLAGNDDSAGWVVMYSLIRSCELNGVEPWTYLRDVLSRLAEGWPEARLGELPYRWSSLKD